MNNEHVIPITFGRTQDEVTVVLTQNNLALKTIAKLSVEDAKCLHLVLGYLIQEIEKQQAEKYRELLAMQARGQVWEGKEW